MIKRIISNGKTALITKCLVRGHRSSKACDFRTTPKKELRAYQPSRRKATRAVVVVTPKCSDHVKVVVTVVAKKAGAPRKAWTRSWAVDNKPSIVCTTHGTG